MTTISETVQNFLSGSPQISKIPKGHLTDTSTNEKINLKALAKKYNIKLYWCQASTTSKFCKGLVEQKEHYTLVFNLPTCNVLEGVCAKTEGIQQGFSIAIDMILTHQQKVNHDNCNEMESEDKFFNRSGQEIKQDKGKANITQEDK